MFEIGRFRINRSISHTKKALVLCGSMDALLIIDPVLDDLHIGRKSEKERDRMRDRVREGQGERGTGCETGTE